jgi:hypothetical protein
MVHLHGACNDHTSQLTSAVPDPGSWSFPVLDAVVALLLCTCLRPGFPPGPPGDQSLSLLSDPLACISRLRREHGPLVGLLLGGERVVLVADPAAAKQVSWHRLSVPTCA